MKSMMILGAMAGFILGAGSSYAGECAGSTIFWHASVAALVGGILARWWGRMWFASLADAIQQQRRARAQASATNTPAKV